MNGKLTIACGAMPVHGVPGNLSLALTDALPAPTLFEPGDGRTLAFTTLFPQTYVRAQSHRSDGRWALPFRWWLVDRCAAFSTSPWPRLNLILEPEWCKLTADLRGPFMDVYPVNCAGTIVLETSESFTLRGQFGAVKSRWQGFGKGFLVGAITATIDAVS
jgi:hypothetical protein